MPQIFILWCVLIVTNLAIRPIMPIDETRYISVAWEMWTRGDFLVPHLNGETYSHKPPLLFWLMQLSWWIFGINDITPRLISPLFALGTTLLSGHVARELWRDRPQISQFAPLILLGTSFWLLFSTLTMFDMLLAFFVLLAIFSVLKLSQTNSWHFVALLGLAIGGGVLSKGPAVLLHILPVALLAPWWLKNKTTNSRWSDWYLKLLAAIFIGASLALAWAIPASISGGEEYRNAIFLGQTSGRLVESFAHKLPVWWYLECLPLLLLPWLFFKPLWQGAKKLNLNDNGVRFCLAWALPVFIAFSLVSGKRIHYLLPLIPAFALLLARVADEILDIKSWQKAHSIVLIIFSIIVLAANLFLMLNGKNHWLPTLNFTLLSGVFGLIIIVATLLSLYLPPAKNINNLLFQTTAAAIIVPIFLAFCYFENNTPRFNTKPIAQKIAQFQNENQPVAFYTGKYHAQFQFTGRLTQPLTLLASREILHLWAQEHKNGVILLDSEKLPDTFFFYSHPYRAGELGFIESKTLLEHFAYIP